MRLRDIYGETVDEHLTDLEKNINKKIILTGFMLRNTPKEDKRNKPACDPYL